MKKLLKLGIFATSLLLNVSMVKADKCDELQMIGQGDFAQNIGIKMNYGSNKTEIPLYTLKNTANAAFTSYCRNPGVSAGISKTGQTIYKCEHTVFDVENNDETTNAYDAGIAAILKNGYSTRNPSYNNLGGNKGYVATNLALRTYELFWETKNSNGKNNSKLYLGHQYYVNVWLDDPTIQSLLKESVGSVRSKFSNALTVNGFIDESGNAITPEIEQEAKRLVILGLEASRYYRQNGAARIKGLDQNPIKVKNPVITDKDGKKTYKYTLTYNFELINFKSKDAYVKMNYTCPECTKYGMDYTLYINGENIGKDISNIDLLKYITNGTGKIEFKIEYSATSDTYKCEELNTKIDFNYYDETINVEAYDLYSTSCTKSTGCQHFYFLYAKDVEKTATVEVPVKLCTLTCEELKKMCEQNVPNGCERFEEEYNSTCAKCTTYINNAECTEEDSKINLIEGMDVDTSACESVSDDNLNVLDCVIKNEDPAGNSYKATTSNFSNTVNNKYCSVWCKEDYHFVLPGIKEANSGRYFSLQASVEGNKRCYTSLIDEDQEFEEDLEQRRKAVIDAWNEWNKWYQALYGTYEDLENPHSDFNYSCNNGEYIEGTDANGNAYVSYKCYESCNCSVNYDGYKRTWNYEAYTYTGGIVNRTYTDTRDGGYAICSCHSGSGANGTITNLENAIKGSLNSAKSSLEGAINSYVKLIQQYTSCSGIDTATYDITLELLNFEGWKMNYNYDPKIKFWYQESYMNSVLTDELETIGNATVGGFKQSFCTESTDNSYEECTSGWKEKLDKNDPEVLKSQFVCKKNGDIYTCGTESIVVSNAKYVKQEMESSGKYTTPTQFYTIYPTGAIVVAEEGKSEEIENSKELTNLLPVGLGTTQGVYNYILKVKDLGEFYNKGNLGRIWGDEDSVVVNVLEDENTCTKTGALQTEIKVDNTTHDSGVYVCAYKINCPDCPVECEPDGCYNPDCPTNKCPVECDNCIYTNNAINVSYRPITSGDINPNDRDLGVNWKYDDNSINTALELKAYATTTEIEESGETIYDIDYEDTSSSDGDFAMKITLDTKMINKIREYNEKYEDNGGFTNNTLKCYDHVNSNDGKTYENIYCYSTFIDELLYDSSSKDNVKIVGNRIIGSDATSTDKLRKTQTQSSGYWTTWSEANSNNWTITTQNGLAYYKSNYGEIGIGPSWK